MIAPAMIKILALPMKFLAIFLPKRKSLWVFGASNGNKYNDNPKALFEYVLVNHPEITAVWLTRSGQVLRRLHAENKPAFAFHSLKGLYYALSAKVLVICHSHLDLSLAAYLFPWKSLIVQTWHGTPLKNIENFAFDGGKNAFYHMFLAYVGRHADMVVSDTDLNIEIYKRYFKVSEDQIAVTGQPRNDILIQAKAKEIKSDSKQIFYLPTWREYNRSFDFFGFGFDLRSMDEFLGRNNAILICKLHSSDQQNYAKIQQQLEKAKNIRLSNIDDVYEQLPSTDILVTDYSSVYFDFLVLDRPIVFSAFDLDEYSAKRGFYYNFRDVAPGHIAKDWKEVQQALGELLGGDDTYKVAREKTNRMFNKFQDGRNSQRAFERIRSTLK
jgi:CDP-glycerol glycerophosphotransferase (TagB/SpsB family)